MIGRSDESGRSVEMTIASSAEPGRRAFSRIARLVKPAVIANKSTRQPEKSIARSEKSIGRSEKSIG